MRKIIRPEEEERAEEEKEEEKNKNNWPTYHPNIDSPQKNFTVM